MNRRRFLASLGVAASLGGCTGTADSADGGPPTPMSTDPGAPAVAWTATFVSRTGAALAPTSDGDCVVVGAATANQADTGRTAWVARMAADGEEAWTWAGGAGRATDALPVGDGVVVLGSLPAGDDGGDVWLAAFDGAGNVAWTNVLGGAAADTAAALTRADDGGYACAGAAAGRAALVRTDERGRERWSHTYDPLGAQVSAVLAVPNGGFALAGRVASAEAAGRPWLIRTDVAGERRWRRTYGDPRDDGTVTSLLPAPDAGFVLAGHDAGVGRSAAGWLRRVDAAGVPVWERRVGGLFAARAASAHGGGVVLAGRRQGVLELRRVADDGETAWYRRYPEAPVVTPQEVVRTAGGYAVLGDGDRPDGTLVAFE